jgi:hypothetical protein
LVELGGVFAVRDEGVAWVVVAGGELPEVAVGRLLPGGVGIGGDDDRSCGVVAVGAEPPGLDVGECSAPGRDADIAALAGEGDGQRVDRAFDKHGARASGERGTVLGQAV